MTMKGNRGKPGLTLIELLFAIAVMSFALLGVAGMFLAAFRSVAAGGHETKATTLARAMADMIRNQPFDNLPKNPAQGGYNGFNTQSVIVSCPVPPPDPILYDPDYAKKKWTCDLQASAAQDSGLGLPGGYGTVAVDCLQPNGTSGPCGGTNLLQVTVTVTWERQGPRSVGVVTYVSRN
jgi:type IV pilus modification protein PilV